MAMQHRPLSLLETTRFGLPLGGRWFRTEQAVVEQHAKRPGYLLAWDTPHKGKLFGIYWDLSIDEFSRVLGKVPRERRHGYQLMLSTQECPGYMLLEWTGPPDSAHAILHHAGEGSLDRPFGSKRLQFAGGEHDLVNLGEDRIHKGQRCGADDRPDQRLAPDWCRFEAHLLGVHPAQGKR